MGCPVGSYTSLHLTWCNGQAHIKRLLLPPCTERKHRHGLELTAAVLQVEEWFENNTFHDASSSYLMGSWIYLSIFISLYSFYDFMKKILFLRFGYSCPTDIFTNAQKFHSIFWMVKKMNTLYDLSWGPTGIHYCGCCFFIYIHPFVAVFCIWCFCMVSGGATGATAETMRLNLYIVFIPVLWTIAFLVLMTTPNALHTVFMQCNYVQHFLFEKEHFGFSIFPKDTNLLALLLLFELWWHPGWQFPSVSTFYS